MSRTAGAVIPVSKVTAICVCRFGMHCKLQSPLTRATKRTEWKGPVCWSFFCLSESYNTSTRSGNWVAGSKSSKYGQGFTSKWDVKCLMSTLKLAAETSLCQISSWSKPSDYLAVCRCFSWSFLRCTDHSRFVIFSFIVKTARTIVRHRLRSSPPKSVCWFPCFCRSLAADKIRIIQNTSFYKKLYSNKNEKQSTKIHNISRPD